MESLKKKKIEIVLKQRDDENIWT